MGLQDARTLVSFGEWLVQNFGAREAAAVVCCVIACGTWLVVQLMKGGQ